MHSGHKKANKTRKTLKPKQIALHLMNNAAPTARNNGVRQMSGPLTKITKQDIDFFESMPVVEVGKHLPGATPYECAAHLYEHVATRFPIEQYEKYIGDVQSYSQTYSYEERTRTKIPHSVMESVMPLLVVRGVQPKINTYMKCVRIVANVEGKHIDTICIISRTTTYIQCIAIGTRQDVGIYSIPEFRYNDGDHPLNPIELSLWNADVHIDRINKSELVGLETGTKAMKVVLSWTALFNPHGAFDVTLEDHASIPCGESSIRLSLVQFLTRPSQRLSWYNSFGFQSKMDVNMELVKDCQAAIQALPVGAIAEYFQSLLDTPPSKKVWYVKTNVESVYVIPSEVAAEDNELPKELMTNVISAMRGLSTTVKDFFTDTKNCAYLSALPYQSDIPIAYVDTSHGSPVTRMFPCAREFLYIEPRLGEGRVIKAHDKKKHTSRRSRH